MLDCLWIQKLHSIGLLSAGFILGDYLQTLRTYFNHREYLVDQTSRYMNKMQKSLRLMNIRPDVAISDITGKTGRAIIDAILKGNRDLQYLASLADRHIKKAALK